MPQMSKTGGDVGEFFVGDTEPTNSWSNGDLWYDTNNSILNYNDNGTARKVALNANLTANSVLQTDANGDIEAGVSFSGNGKKIIQINSTEDGTTSKEASSIEEAAGVDS